MTDAAELRRRTAELLAARGAIKPLVSERVPLSGAAAAVQRVADGVTTGRIAVVPALQNGAAA